jgi:pimeloyl-ACP methyl ester carboxylesterase
MRHGLWALFTVLSLPLNLRAADAPDPLDKAPSKFAKSGDLKVHYKSLGEGKTAVVFIHGWCCDLSVWQHQAAAFDGKVRMLFVDLPGYGKSDSPRIDYTMDVFAKGVNAVLEDAAVERAVLVGHSMGTPVVRQFYRLFPDKTKALVFVDGALRPMGDPQQRERMMSMFKEETFKETAPRFLTSMLTQSTPEIRQHIERLVANTTPQVAISSMRGMLDDSNWKDDQVKVPSQALMAKSPFWNEEYQAFLKKLVPDLDYREYEGVSHFLFMDKPKEFNEALAEFLKKQGVLK